MREIGGREFEGFVGSEETHKESEIRNWRGKRELEKTARLEEEGKRKLKQCHGIEEKVSAKER
jgi:hypothetical protein